ncbi:MAG: D-tyrosyl-tRNA(Tyr) deacylase [Candidatus Riflebacteria bacterium]|nr:D-tyrosyl-tRNA(Tyr) deacylase [Candidatus Riflebacteria bacterium]
MKTVVQRVSNASLRVDGQLISSISKGLVCYLGVGKGDTEDTVKRMARKVAGLRIFSDNEGKMNLSAKDCSYEIMAVSQFTLYGDVKKGFRPSFIGAEEPEQAKLLYECFCKELESLGIQKVARGIFGADMHIEQNNSGPVTIIIEMPAADN